MADMVTAQEATQHVEDVRRDLGEQLRALADERRKLVAKLDSLSHKHSALDSEIHSAMTRLRSVLASLSQYIESKDVSYEYKKSVGLSQVHIKYRGEYTNFAICYIILCFSESSNHLI